MNNKRFRRSATWTAVLDLLGNGVKVVTLNGQGSHRRTEMQSGIVVMTMNVIQNDVSRNVHTLPNGNRIIVS